MIVFTADEGVILSFFELIAFIIYMYPPSYMQVNLHIRLMKKSP